MVLLLEERMEKDVVLLGSGDQCDLLLLNE